MDASSDSTINSLTDEAAALTEQTAGQSAEAEGEGAPLTADGYFALRNCDSASLSSFSLDTPSLPRKLHAQEDTDSLVSTGTLVPEAIYLPPAGHRLVTHSDWDALNTQVQTRKVSQFHGSRVWFRKCCASQLWLVCFDECVSVSVSCRSCVVK